MKDPEYLTMLCFWLTFPQMTVSYETSDNSGTPVINRSIKYNCKIIPEEF